MHMFTFFYWVRITRMYVSKHDFNSPWFEHHSTIIDWNHLKNVDKKLPILLTKMLELVKDLLSLIPT